MTITITGISGHMGRLVATHILKRSLTATINGTCRTPSKLPKDLLSHSRVKIFQTDLTKDQEIRDAVRGSNIAIFAALGDFNFMAHTQKRIIDACIVEGVPRYMAGDWSLDFRKLEYGQLPAKDPMKTVDEYLEQKERETEGELSAVHVLNACFTEVPWRGIYDPVGRTLMYWGSGEEKWELTTYEDAAKFSAAIALDEDAKGWFKGAKIQTSSKHHIQLTQHDQSAATTSPSRQWLLFSNQPLVSSPSSNILAPSTTFTA